MTRTIRSSTAGISLVIGPMVILIGLGAALAAVIVSVALGTAWFLLLLIPAALAMAGGTLILAMWRRARLEIGTEGFTWCGHLGAAQSLRWEQVHRILPPVDGASRSVALVQLRDGQMKELRAVWESPTSPIALLGGVDHSGTREALVSAHQSWLVARR